MKPRAIISALTLWLAAVNCNSVSGPDPAEQIFTAALDQWNELGPDSYDMVLRRECFCAVPIVDVTIQVRDNVVISRTYTDTGDPVEPGVVALFPDVPGLFTFVRSAMDGDPYYFSASYDSSYGHPIEIQLDVAAGRSDDNLIYRTRSLTPVP
jgi:hypothetical protein